MNNREKRILNCFQPYEEKKKKIIKSNTLTYVRRETKNFLGIFGKLTKIQKWKIKRI